GGYQTVNFPLNPVDYPYVWNELVGSDGAGRRYGLFSAWFFGNGVFQRTDWAHYTADNGTFAIWPTPGSITVNNPARVVYDVNSSGQILGQDADGKIFLFDDGGFYTVTV